MTDFYYKLKNMWILYNFLTDILFPKSCFVCKKPKNIICKNCLTNFSRAVDSTSAYTYSHFSYKDENIKKIIHYIKYFHQKDLIRPLVEESLNDFKKLIDIERKYLLIPIPSTRLRKMIRGYNQAEIISKTYSELLNIPYQTNILYRNKNTKQQAKSKNKTERINNQKGSFQIKNFESLKDKTIILCDDVTTTGATLEEARNVLLKNGFKNIVAITLAH